MDATSSLFEGATTGDEQLVEKALKMGVEVDTPDFRGDGDTALMKAAANGKHRMCDFLLKKGAVVNERNEFGRTPLMFASCYGHLKTAFLLRDRGGDINAQDNEGNTSLMYAASAGNVELVKFLLKFNAWMNLSNEDGYTAVTVASNPEIKDMLENQSRVHTTSVSSA